VGGSFNEIRNGVAIDAKDTMSSLLALENPWSVWMLAPGNEIHAIKWAVFETLDILVTISSSFHLPFVTRRLINPAAGSVRRKLINSPKCFFSTSLE
jgi:hypothetical protein